MPQLDVTNWTALLVALSPLLVAVARRESWSPNVVAVATLAIVSVVFFVGRLLDGALMWPLPPAMAAELAAALVANQVIYAVTKNTTVIKVAERIGNPE